MQIEASIERRPAIAHLRLLIKLLFWLTVQDGGRDSERRGPVIGSSRSEINMNVMLAYVVPTSGPRTRSPGLLRFIVIGAIWVPEDKRQELIGVVPKPTIYR